MSKAEIFPSWIRPTNPERRSSLKAINLAKVKSGYSQFESICTGAQANTYKHKGSFLYQTHPLFSSLKEGAWLTKRVKSQHIKVQCLQPALPNTAHTRNWQKMVSAKMKVWLKLLGENSISRSVSRLKMLEHAGKWAHSAASSLHHFT